MKGVHSFDVSKCQRAVDYSADGFRSFGSFSAPSRLKLLSNSVIAEVRLKITRILLQIKIRHKEKKKNMMIHMSFKYSMGNSGRNAANNSKIQNGC